MGKKKQVEEVEEEVELTPDLALAQAANVLILASEKADHNNDVEALMKIAGGWMEIHEYLAGSHSPEQRKPALGFVGNKSIEAELEELEDAIAAEDSFRPKIIMRTRKVNIFRTR